MFGILFHLSQSSQFILNKEFSIITSLLTI